MNKASLITLLRIKYGFDIKKSREIIETMFDWFAEGLKRDRKVAISEFGSLYVYDMKEKETTVPSTGERIKINATKCVGFRPSPTLKKKING